MKAKYLYIVVILVLAILTGCSIFVRLADSDTLDGAEIDGMEDPHEYDTILCYIIEYDVENAVLFYDEIEWVCLTDKKRIKELDLDAEYDFPNGFYIHNDNEMILTLEVSDIVTVYLVNLADTFNPYITDMEGLLKRQTEYKAPYYLKIKDKVVHKIEEQFIP